MDLLKNAMIDLRNKKVENENAIFHATLTSILETERANINYLKLKNTLLQKALDDISNTVISTSIEFNIDSLFKEGLTYENGKMVWNKDQLIFTFLDSAGKICRYICDKSIQDCTKAFEDYMYTQEPTLQSIRKEVQSEFPNATLSPWIFIHTGSKCVFKIGIRYELDKVAVSDQAEKPERHKYWQTVLW